MEEANTPRRAARLSRNPSFLSLCLFPLLLLFLRILLSASLYLSQLALAFSLSLCVYMCGYIYIALSMCIVIRRVRGVKRMEGGGGSIYAFLCVSLQQSKSF